MNSILISRPNHDDITRYLHVWSEDIIREANKRDMAIFDLSGERANKGDVTSFLANKRPKFAVFNGHGNEMEIGGWNDETIIMLGENEALLRGKIAYSVSCKSAKELGRECIKSAGCLVFIGYEEDFVFYYNPNKMSNPLSDDIAAPNLDSSNQVAISLIKGNNAGDSFEMSQKKFRKFIRKFIRSRELEAPYILQTLINNMMNQKLHGDTDCKI